MSDDCLPDCMMPDGGQCCAGYHKQRQRIAALEAALREFISYYNTSDHGWNYPELYRLREKVKAVLAPEQDK